MARCADLAAELDLDGAATFEGRVGSAGRGLHAGHVVLLTSISEGLPYTVLEAMATGRPVVATDVGGVGEAVGDAGLLVPPRNPSAVAAACVQLLANAEERRARGKAARSRVVDLFTAKAAFRHLPEALPGGGATAAAQGPGARPPQPQEEGRPSKDAAHEVAAV